MIQPKTLKGFRDFLPKEARKRQYVIETLKRVFESYGFEPLETPALEYEEILSGKYGEEGDKLMYRFEDNGGRRVAMRYDQTVPLARVVAQYRNDLPLPFKRYQISNVWRAENTQRGRFREFMQCDIDTVGIDSLLADAEIIEAAIESLKNLGFEKFKVLINSRKVFTDLVDQNIITSDALPSVVRSIDKLKKIGQEGVLEELGKLGIDKEARVRIMRQVEEILPPEDFMELFEYLKKMGISETQYEFTPTLARGLDYYTGTIFEIEIEGYDAGSVCGGGRYDNLVGMFENQTVPAVGCAFGFDRLMEAMNALNLFPSELQETKVLVTVFSDDLTEKSVQIVSELRKKAINAEIYLDPNSNMDKQLKYADKKGIQYVIIIGPKEVESNSATVKNMKTGEQKTVQLEELPNVLV